MELLDKKIEFDTYVNMRKEKVIMTLFDHSKFDKQYLLTEEPVKNKLKDFGNRSRKEKQVCY